MFPLAGRIYLGACAFVMLSGALLWPQAPFEAARDDPEDESAATADLTNLLNADPPPSFRSQLSSRAFAYLVCFASIHILRLNFVVGTFQLQAAALGLDAAGVARYTNYFASALPFGFVGMPIIGFVLDKRPLSNVFLLVNACGSAPLPY